MEASLSCPWSSFTAGTLEFCEAQLCSWVVSPAETWSNLFYIGIGLGLWREGFKQHDELAKTFGFFAFIVGAFSFLYHMSHINLLEILDLGSMLFLGVYLLRQNLIRLGVLPFSKKTPFDIIVGLTSFLLLIFLSGVNRLMVFGGLIFLALSAESFLWFKNKKAKKREIINYRFLKVSLVIFLISYFFWWIDFEKIGCDPHTHWWSGHALWHAINAFCFLTLYRFYRHLDKIR